jgi:dipeptidyl aminopeptidase/acylaminoacyl peptidase
VHFVAGVSLCESGAYFVETSTRVDAVPVSTLRSAATGIAVMQLEESDISQLLGARRAKVFVLPQCHSAESETLRCVRCRLAVSGAVHRKGGRWRHGEQLKANLDYQLKSTLSQLDVLVFTQDIYGVMYKPFDFDPAKSYPIVAYVYPGPQTGENTIDSPYHCSESSCRWGMLQCTIPIALLDDTARMRSESQRL